MAEEEKIAVDGSDSTVAAETGNRDESKVELNQSRGESDEVSGGSVSDEEQRRGESDNDQKQRKRRQRRWKGGRRHRNRKHPYASVTSHASGDRPAMKEGKYPHAPRNTTQYLIEDHVKSNISPDLSNKASPASFDETDFVADRRIIESNLLTAVPQQDADKGLRPQDSSTPFMELNPLTQEFNDVYQKLNEDRLYNMSKDELIALMSSRLNRTAMVDGGGRGVGADDKIDKAGEVGEEGLRESPTNSTPLGSCNRDNKME